MSALIRLQLVALLRFVRSVPGLAVGLFYLAFAVLLSASPPDGSLMPHAALFAELATLLHSVQVAWLIQNQTQPVVWQLPVRTRQIPIAFILAHGAAAAPAWMLVVGLLGFHAGQAPAETIVEGLNFLLLDCVGLAALARISVPRDGVPGRRQIIAMSLTVGLLAGLTMAVSSERAFTHPGWLAPLALLASLLAWSAVGSHRAREAPPATRPTRGRQARARAATRWYGWSVIRAAWSGGPLWAWVIMLPLFALMPSATLGVFVGFFTFLGMLNLLQGPMRAWTWLAPTPIPRARALALLLAPLAALWLTCGALRLGAVDLFWSDAQLLLADSSPSAPGGPRVPKLLTTGPQGPPVEELYGLRENASGGQAAAGLSRLLRDRFAIQADTRRIEQRLAAQVAGDGGNGGHAARNPVLAPWYQEARAAILVREAADQLLVLTLALLMLSVALTGWKRMSLVLVLLGVPGMIAGFTISLGAGFREGLRRSIYLDWINPAYGFLQRHAAESFTLWAVLLILLLRLAVAAARRLETTMLPRPFWATGARR